MYVTTFIYARAMFVAIVCVSVPMLLTNPFTFTRGVIIGYVSSVLIGTVAYLIGLAMKPTWNVLRCLFKKNPIVVA